VVGFVKRTGTAGDVLAPMVVDPLITHADAARARGGSILANTGKQAMVTVDLPLYDEIGLIEPGTLVQVDDATAWRGLSRAVSVSAQWTNELKVNQSVELERHY
jgi:hypothetical protein